MSLVVFLGGAESGKLGIGADARVIPDAAPDYAIPTKVSFVASASKLTPKSVGTKDERAKLMFRVRLRINPQELERRYWKLEPGVNGSGFVRTKADAEWPAELEVKLPPAPAPVEEMSQPSTLPAPAAEASAPRPPASAVAQPPTAAPSSPSRAARASAPAAQASASPPAAPIVPQKPTPPPESSKPATPAPSSEKPSSAPAVATEASVDPIPEFASASVDQLVGAWAPSAADCERLVHRHAKALAFRQPADQFAPAASVDAHRIRLPSSACQLESASREEGALNLSADCADSISYTSRIVCFQLRSNTERLYSPTGDPALATNIVECSSVTESAEIGSKQRGV